MMLFRHSGDHLHQRGLKDTNNKLTLSMFFSINLYGKAYLPPYNNQESIQYLLTYHLQIFFTKNNEKIFPNNILSDIN